MKFWLVLFITFLVIRYVLPVVLRLVLGNFVRKQMRNNGFGEVQPPFQQESPTGKPGQIRVDYVPPTQPKPSEPKEFKGGEYVDFEEV